MCRRWLAIFHTSSARFGRPHATMEEGISLAAQFVVNDLSRAISAWKVGCCFRTTRLMIRSLLSMLRLMQNALV